MKASEIRELSPEELHRRIAELKQELFNLRFQHEIGQLENPKKMMKTKHDVARINTILREKESTTQTAKE
jgi:large subunit ribosomal protein L29